MDTATLRRLARQNQRDKAREAASYEALLDAVWEAHDAGWRQVEIVKAVELTRERVRQILDADYRAKVMRVREIRDAQQ